MAVVQIDRALALWHLAATDSLRRGCAVATLHIDVLLVGEVDVGLGWRDCDGCHAGCVLQLDIDRKTFELGEN